MELLTGGSKLCSSLVSNEKWSAQLFFQNPDSCTYGGLGNVKISGRSDEASGFQYLQKRAGNRDVHDPRTFARALRIMILSGYLLVF
jgi:hypothetical protein